MAKHLIVAFTNPVEGKDAEYNHWYDTVGIPTYKTLPGLVPLGRFKAVNIPPMFDFERANEYQYLSLYYFEADDPQAFMEKIKETFADRPEYFFCPDIDQSKFFEPMFVAISDVNFEPIDRFESLKR